VTEQALHGLTDEAWARLLAFLDEDVDRAARLYEAIRARLVRIFEWRRLASADELADEVINRVARKLVEGEQVRTTDRYAFFAGVARFVCQEAARRQGR
jgi:hypothetical protein